MVEHFFKVSRTNRYDTFPKTSCTKLCTALFSQLWLLLKKEVQNQDLHIILPILEETLPVSNLKGKIFFHIPLLKKGKVREAESSQRLADWLYLISDFWSSTWRQNICMTDTLHAVTLQKKKKSLRAQVFETQTFTTGSQTSSQTKRGSFQTRRIKGNKIHRIDIPPARGWEVMFVRGWFGWSSGGLLSPCSRWWVLPGRGRITARVICRTRRTFLSTGAFRRIPGKQKAACLTGLRWH